MNEKIIAFSSASAILYGLWGTFIAVSLKLGMSPAAAGSVTYITASLAGLALSAGRLLPPKREWAASGLPFASAQFLLLTQLKLI